VNNATRILGKPIDAEDGPIGSVHDLYFDEQTWNVRYLVADTGKWLPGRKVLVIPDAIETPWHHEDVLPVNLTRDQIQSSPEIDTDQPVSRVAEESLYRHYSWTPYWGDLTTVPVPQPPAPPVIADPGQGAAPLADPTLRSAKEVVGYHVEATDGDIGAVEDVLLDDDFRRVLFLAVHVKGLFSGKTVLAPPSFVARVDWETSRVYLEVTRQAIKSGQEYKPAA
jgi:hypothetical protein